jgi:hypothetical protein
MGIYRTIIDIYKLKYIAINAAAFVLYYLIARYLVVSQEKVFLIVNPLLYYMLFPLVLTSSILLTIAIYSIGNTRRNMAKLTATGFGAATMLIGSVVVSCGCAVPILFSLAAIGLSSADIIYLNVFLSTYSIEAITIFIFLNLIITIYYLNKLSKPSCRIGKR